MNKKLLLIIIFSVWSIGELFSQDQKPEMAKAVTGFDKPIYVVMYEIIPNKPTECVYPMNTIIFEIPVDEEYYNSVTINQEVSTWFKTSGNNYLMGNVNPTDMLSKWKLIIRSKKIVSK